MSNYERIRELIDLIEEKVQEDDELLISIRIGENVRKEEWYYKAYNTFVNRFSHLFGVDVIANTLEYFWRRIKDRL